MFVGGCGGAWGLPEVSGEQEKMTRVYGTAVKHAATDAVIVIRLVASYKPISSNHIAEGLNKTPLKRTRIEILLIMSTLRCS